MLNTTQPHGLLLKQKKDFRFLRPEVSDTSGNNGFKLPKGNYQSRAIYRIISGLNHLFTLTMPAGLGFGLHGSATRLPLDQLDYGNSCECWSLLLALPPPFLEEQEDTLLGHSFI